MQEGSGSRLTRNKDDAEEVVQELTRNTCRTWLRRERGKGIEVMFNEQTHRPKLVAIIAKIPLGTVMSRLSLARRG